MKILIILTFCAVLASIRAVSYDVPKNLAQRIVSMVQDKYDLNSKASSSMFAYISNMDAYV